MKFFSDVINYCKLSRLQTQFIETYLVNKSNAIINVEVH